MWVLLGRSWFGLLCIWLRSSRLLCSGWRLGWRGWLGWVRGRGWVSRGLRGWGGAGGGGGGWRGRGWSQGGGWMGNSWGGLGIGDLGGWGVWGRWLGWSCRSLILWRRIRGKRLFGVLRMISARAWSFLDIPLGLLEGSGNGSSPNRTSWLCS